MSQKKITSKSEEKTAFDSNFYQQEVKNRLLGKEQFKSKKDS